MSFELIRMQLPEKWQNLLDIELQELKQQNEALNAELEIKTKALELIVKEFNDECIYDYICSDCIRSDVCAYFIARNALNSDSLGRKQEG